jgi:hypothetical protein
MFHEVFVKGQLKALRDIFQMRSSDSEQAYFVCLEMDFRREFPAALLMTLQISYRWISLLNIHHMGDESHELNTLHLFF